jgi:methylmalonyl-CoA/ethylmalonyl-CoA epimerase
VGTDEGAAEFRGELAERLTPRTAEPGATQSESFRCRDAAVSCDSPSGANRMRGGEGNRMANEPLGKLDHIGIAVKSLAEARKFFEDVLGARFLYEHENSEAGYRLIELDFNGVTFELLEPLGDESFLRAFLEKRGEGLHHLTFEVPKSKEKIAELKERGVRVVDEREFSPDSYEAFISPRASHGVLIQIGSGYPTLARAAEWSKEKK